MNLIDSLISKLVPHDCISCGYEGRLVCANCAETGFKIVPSRCYRCRKLTPNATTCRSCRSVSRLKAVHVAVVYEGVAKELVWRLKFSGAQAAASELTSYMTFPAAGCIVPVPTATSRVRRRGYDQSKLIARELARQNRLPYIDCLRRSGQAHQVGASRHERLHQLNNAFRVNNIRKVAGRSIILVDDVVTTGATLEAAATTLREAGAKKVEAVVFAQP